MKILEPVTSSMIVFVMAAASLLPAFGQSRAPSSTSNPMAAALRTYLARYSRIMAAAAEEMPANKYSFKPTAGSRTFGALVLHIGNANRMACHWLTGAAAAPKNNLTASSPKNELVASLKSSFNYCSQALGSFNDSKLNARVPFYGHRTMTVASSVLALAGDWADHYSQQAAYLRANGMLPPTAHHGQP